MNDFIGKILGNKLVVWILAALVVFALLKLTGINFSFSVGASGIHAGVGQ